MSAADYAYVRGLVQRRSAMALAPGKEYLVVSRLLPIARSSGEDTLDRLIERLRTSREGELHSRVVEAMTVNETSWFRDHRPFDALDTEILPALVRARARDRRLTIWSAGCSSGQEAYSIAMLLSERLAGDPSWRMSILASDISTDMVRRTADGRYSQLEVNRGLPIGRLVRHFSKVGTEWQVAAGLRSMVEARRINLAETWPSLPLFDVVFLRNVLIYFDAPAKRAVLEQVRRVLRPDGYLALGGAETLLNVHQGFSRCLVGEAAFYRTRAGAVT